VTSLAGGAADKAGNRYEHWWTVFRIGDVLEGRASRIRLEPLGAAGIGVEFEVDEAGATWVEQVKAGTSSGSWTLNKLAKEGVLGAIRGHVSAGRPFRLVVASGAAQLADLEARARWAESFDEFTDVLTGEQSADLERVAATWDVTEVEAWALLKLVEVRHHTADSLQQLVRTTFKRLTANDPDLVIAEIRRYCDDHLHESLTAPKIWAHLESKGIRRRRLVGDERVVNALHRTVERHLRRVERSAPTIGLVARRDVASMLDRLRNETAPQTTVLDGPAGFGKSTVVSAVATTLEAEGWFVAVARMDGVLRTTNTSDQVGAAIGLDDSPAVLIAGVADGSPALLVVEQLDAVSTYSGRLSDAFDAVEELLDEVTQTPNVKVLLVVRTVDLEADARLRRLVSSAAGVDRHTVGRLHGEDVKRLLANAGMQAPTSTLTLELLRTPLHLAVFTRLSSTAREHEYRTIQELYDQYSMEVRRSVEDRIGHLDWLVITNALVEYMNNHEVLTAPAALLDRVATGEVAALESEAVLVRDDGRIAFFHESYFDYLFARAFAGTNQDLHAFLADSGQHLFRRAQTRQVLEHLAATDRPRFRAVVARLLTSDQIRAHIKDVVVGVLGQLDPVKDDWEAIDDIAWSDAPVARKLQYLLARPGWFDVADVLGLWQRWLADEASVANAFTQLVSAARIRPQRATELVRPYIGASEDWTRRLRLLIEWSPQPEFVDLAVELLELGQLDDARGPLAENSDFWSIVHLLQADDPAAAARLTGAFLRRGLARALADTSFDPFESEHLATYSPSSSVVSDIAEAAPKEFVEQVLPFVAAVSSAGLRTLPGRFPAGSRWRFRHRSDHHSVDGALFSSLENALRRLAAVNPGRCDSFLELLRSAESDELRFLACRALTARGSADGAIEWLVSDDRNLALGWADSPHWASRELIEAWTPSCSEKTFARLEAHLLSYQPAWETRQSAGHGRYELLSALSSSRLSDAARRRLEELERRFSASPPRPPEPIEAHFVGPPISDEQSKHMSDDDWLRALRKHSSDKTDWHRGPVPVGGARELAQVLGRRAKEDPRRFAQLALRLGSDVPSAAIDNVISNIAGVVDLEVLTGVCEHASYLHGPAVGRAICSAIHRAGGANSRLVGLIEKYAADLDPDHESARTEASSGQPYYGGDLLTAGLNSTRGQAALAAASLLFASGDYLDQLTPVVESLAVDQILAVRVCAADAVTGLLNHAPGRALAAAERLLDTSIDVYDARTVEHLLVYVVLRSSDRFGPALRRALSGPDPVSERGGRAWAIAAIRDALPPSVVQETGGLPPAARRGVAEVFGEYPDGELDRLTPLFSDEDATVRERAARAMRNLEDVPPDKVDNLIRAFMGSTAFGEHFEDLIHSLEYANLRLSTAALEACERAVALAGTELGDIRASRAITGRSLITVVLRLYRQGDAAIRTRCLDIIDRLTELNAYGVAAALEAER
jgi:hypothetical protein